ncbi:MAG: SDR family oxidoreductase [Desulfarculus sp.]|nr:SDR family oxidoreductase [Desulfarculus sp.]
MRPLKELMDLRGRVALITGGAGHLGSAMAEALAELGAAVAILDLDPTACQERAAAIAQAHDVPSLGLACDLADEAATRAMPEKVAQTLGGLDILINCAAFVGTSQLEGWVTPFAQQSAETWRAALEVNLTAAFVLTQAAAPLLAAQGSGSVINVASIYGILGPDLRLYEGTAMGNPAAYAASKGGLLQLTRWLATVLAPRVRVNGISLGGVWRNQPEIFVERYQARTPQGRMASEDDIKGAAAYLASDLSAYVTGHNLVVDGGWSAW